MANNIADIRKNIVLDTEVNYRDEGVMTRRAFIEAAVKSACKVEEVQLRNYAKEAKEEEWLSKNAWSHPWGNSSHPQTIAYNERKQRLKEGIYKTEYRLFYPDGPYRDITKIEYDYFNSLLSKTAY